MAGTGKSTSLNYARQPVDSAKLNVILKQATLPYEEVDFSQSQTSLQGDALRLVVNICRRCPKLRVLKLFKNDINDQGAETIADMLSQKPEID